VHITKDHTQTKKHTLVQQTNTYSKNVHPQKCAHEKDTKYNKKTQDTPKPDNEKVQVHVKQQTAAQKPAHTLAIERDTA
jgi:hypothetical protein